MPTSPRSPLSFRTAGFPQYGWKAGLSSGAFPSPDQLKPAERRTACPSMWLEADLVGLGKMVWVAAHLNASMLND
jgi:hypothetical protein